MSICSVCGKKVKNFGGKIILGASKEWVCKDCLKKANIGVMKFSMQHITSEQITAMIHGDTAAKNEVQIKRNAKISNKRFKKTVTCRTCGAEISPRAKRCPHCGEMTPGEIVGQAIVGLIMAPFIVIAILIAIGFYFGLFRFLS